MPLSILKSTVVIYWHGAYIFTQRIWKTDREIGAHLAEMGQVEMRRWRVIQAEQVCVVTDGADWLQQFIEMHRSDAVRLLDFPHGASHILNLLEA
jgi:hypothetical protein